MIDVLINGVFGPKQAARRAAPENPSVEISIPKDHPDLPRLYKAAMALPQVTIQQQSGVSYTRNGLYVPGALEEFFSALEAVIGADHALVLEDQLGVRRTLEAGGPADIQALCNLASQMLPLGVMSGLTERALQD